MKTYTELLIEERNIETRNIVIDIVTEVDTEPKRVTLEYLKVNDNGYSLSYDLSYTKRNLLEIDEQICRPKHIEQFKESGKCKLWFSYPKGRSFSQYSFPTTCKIISIEEWLNEKTSGEIFKPKRDEPIVFDVKKYPELANEFYGLISTAYHEIGGHLKIKEPNDIFSDPNWKFWEGIDIHGTEDFDIILFGQKTNYGVKFSGMGHDGTLSAKTTIINEQIEKLKTLGFYAETSGKVAELFIKYKCPIVNNQQEVEKVLGKKVEWIGKNPYYFSSGNSWYVRTIGGKPVAKILIGKPKI